MTFLGYAQFRCICVTDFCTCRSWIGEHSGICVGATGDHDDLFVGLANQRFGSDRRTNSAITWRCLDDSFTGSRRIGFLRSPSVSTCLTVASPLMYWKKMIISRTWEGLWHSYKTTSLMLLSWFLTSEKGRSGAKFQTYCLSMT